MYSQSAARYANLKFYMYPYVEAGNLQSHIYHRSFDKQAPHNEPRFAEVLVQWNLTSVFLF